MDPSSRQTFEAAIGAIRGGETAVLVAIRMLVDHGANVDALFPSDIPRVADPPDAQDVLDRAFQFSCRAGHLDIAKDLLARGADPVAISPANTTALEWAVQNGQHTVARWLNALT